LPDILNKLKNLISAQEIEGYNPPFIKAQQNFLKACKESINPNITISNINEILLQHILTEQIFSSVFRNANFHKQNNVATELNTIQETFSDEIQEVLEQIQAFYSIIHTNAVKIKDYHDKQAFLKMIYENFYKIYNPKAADKMGVVYTPHEIVKFQIESVDYLLEKHFNKTLANEGIKILDPCVGTGTYICDLIDYLPPHRLEYKYKQDIYCNELGLLPYYIANLNIEYTYRQKMESYFKQKKIKPDNKFKNICWVDTLDNTGFGIKGTTKPMFGLSVENTERIKTQNEQHISVIIGNPPYNANQQNENDNNKNRVYESVDDQIRKTYIKESTAQKTKVYDMYARFLRWATDRIDNEQGIISFITNNSFIDSTTFDGFRKCISKEFDFAYIIDLGGGMRKNTDSNDNVFGITIGVAILFLVKTNNISEKAEIYYYRLPNFDSKQEKLQLISSIKFKELFKPDNSDNKIFPDNDANWINQTDNDFESLIPVCDKQTKLGKNQHAIFKLFSLGVVTNRDEWVFDFSKDNLIKKLQFFINVFNTLSDSQIRNEESLDYSIKWTRAVKNDLQKSIKYQFDINLIINCLYRPFTNKNLYFSKQLNEMQYQLPNIFGNVGNLDNKVILFSNGQRQNFLVLSTNKIPSLDIFMPNATNCLPFYIYDKEGKPLENITNWSLELFQNHYNNQEITKEQIFNYVYAVLHDPKYRQKYEQNLKREFPRIPFYDNFEQWAKFGKELIELHLNYETVEKYPLTRIDTDNAKIPKAKLKADKAKGTIQLDDNTRLENVPCEAWEYLLGNRSALEWVLDQYKEKTPKDATIAQNFNTYKFADHKEHVIDLLCRVCKVSVETVRIVQALHNLSPINDP